MKNWKVQAVLLGAVLLGMSMPEKGEAQTDIYIVPVEGGDPVKVEGLSYDLKGKHATGQGSCTLIDWI